MNSINDVYEISRVPVDLTVGAFVVHDSNIFKISEILDFESIIGVCTQTGRSSHLRIKELKPLETDNVLSQDLDEISDPDWQIAQKRYSIIKPLLDDPFYGRREVEGIGKTHNVNTSTIYRWIEKYTRQNNTTALVPKKRGIRNGAKKLPPEKESLINEVIENYYLTVQRNSVQATVFEIQRLSHERGITPPSPTAIRKRISRIPERDVLWRRGQKEKAKNKFDPTAGKFPNADYPLAVVQIDHTPADIIVVDDTYRLPLGRPWITIAMDIYSRMVVGYYLSFDAPSETSLAMCTAQMVLPKDEWLTLHNVSSDWPVWGIPNTVHVDNGSDFRSNNFQKSCETYNINLEYRPVRVPRYGGHVERLLGTILNEIHKLPGTTFSNIKERDSYDSDKHSALTKSELEEWLVNYICRVYHQKTHSSLKISPIKKWELGILGDLQAPGIGMQPRHAEGQTLLLDFLPSFSRTVQTFGVRIDGIFYYSDVLRSWINISDEKTKQKMKFIFRRDPRDISCLWFFDPEIKHYFKIPYADQTLPSMSIWELEQAKKRLKEQGINTTNEPAIFQALTEMRELIKNSAKKTKIARKQLQKQKENAKKITPVIKKSQELPPTEYNTDLSELLTNIDNYTDIE